MEERTLLAERLQKYRSRKAAADRIAEAMASEAKEGLEELLWNTLTAFEGYPFRTAKGLRFHYSIQLNNYANTMRICLPSDNKMTEGEIERDRA